MKTLAGFVVTLLLLAFAFAPRMLGIPVTIEIGDRPYYTRGGGYYVGRSYYAWRPGYWGWRHHHRYWRHGYYHRWH